MVHLLLAHRRNVSLLEADVARLVPVMTEPGSVTGVATNAALDGAVVDLWFASSASLFLSRWLLSHSPGRCRRRRHQDWCCRLSYRCLLDYDPSRTVLGDGRWFRRLNFLLAYWISLPSDRSTVVLIVVSPAVLLMTSSGSSVVTFGVTSGTARTLSRVG